MVKVIVTRFLKFCFNHYIWSRWN